MACRRRTIAVLAAVALSAALGVACGDDDGGGPEMPPRMPREGWPAPSVADGERACADVGDLRACWGPPAEGEASACAAGVCLVERPVPQAPPADGGWRCDGRGAERRCVPQRLGGGAFDCAEDRCAQDHPRLPDVGFWECVDDDGVVVCRGGDPAAGVFAGAPDPGWSCGARRGGDGERICVDAAPDMPRGERRGWKCHFEHGAGERRLCVAEEGAPAVGAPCDDADGCAAGTVCAGGRCLPRRLEPECALDADCADAGGVCRFGTCTETDR